MKRYFIAVVTVVVTMALLTWPAAAMEVSNAPTVPKAKMTLWNGKDFAGWKLFVPDPAHDVTKTWSIKDGVIRCEGRPGSERAATAALLFT